MMSDYVYDPTDTLAGLEALSKISKDIKKAGKTLGKEEARFLVDAYYTHQENRKRSNNQVRALTESEEPNDILKWLAGLEEKLEKSIKAVLHVYAMSTEAGRWLMSMHGIGPVIAAGMLAHIDITKAPTAGAVFSYAGLNPKAEWGKKQKRPWNAALRTLVAFKAGESFVKNSNREGSFYGPVYRDRKEYEQRMNAEGKYAERAQAQLDNKNFKKNTDAYKWLTGQCTKEEYLKFLEACKTATPAKRATLKPKWVGEGEGVQMIPPAQVHASARRVAAKLFLSHFWEVLYWIHIRDMPCKDKDCRVCKTRPTEPPKPYVIAHMDHVHYIPPPNWPMESEAEAAA
jgi:hypothetical protein